MFVNEFLPDLGQRERPGEHAEHLQGIQPTVHQDQDDRHQDHRADAGCLRRGDRADGPGKRGQRAGAVMRGDVLIDAQVEAGHRACLRQQAEKQDQDTERRASQQHGQAMPRYP